MPVPIALIIVIMFAALAAWWLSGYDSKVTGENRTRDFIRRAMRCGMTLFLARILFALPAVTQFMPLVLLIAGLLALIWCGCLTELFARWFHHLVDSDDKREFDPKKNLRDLDLVAHLVRSGRKEEAIQLCLALKESGDVSVLALDTLLEHLGVKPDPVPKPRPLADADRLRLEGKFPEAEAILKSLVMENPANVDAAMMLMRLYAEDLHRSDRAMMVLQSLEKQPHVSAAHAEYARRSIAEWSREKPVPEAVAAQPESMDELLAGRYWGSAIEILEAKIKEQPGDFDSRIKLAEVYGRHCGNMPRAEKIVRQIEAHPEFTSEQRQNARTKLEEWRKGRPYRH
jgi:hypothetical protein